MFECCGLLLFCVTLPFCCICDLCWYGNSSESPKVEVQLCQQQDEKLLALGWHGRAEFQLGLSQHLPNFFPNFFLRCLLVIAGKVPGRGIGGEGIISMSPALRQNAACSAASSLVLWLPPALDALCFLFPSPCACPSLFNISGFPLNSSGQARWHNRSVHRVSPQEAGLFHKCLLSYVWPYFPGLHTQCCLRENRSWGGKKLQLLSSVCFSCVYLTSLFLLSSSKRFVCIAGQVFIKLLSHCGSHHTVTTRTKAKKMQVKEACGVVCLFKEKLDLVGKGENNWNLIFPLGTGCTACLVNSGIGKFMQTCASPPTSQGFHFSSYFSSPPRPLELNSCAAVPLLSASSGLLVKSLPPERVFLLFLGIFPHY